MAVINCKNCPNIFDVDSYSPVCPKCNHNNLAKESIAEQKDKLLWSALLAKGYTCQNPFISDIAIKKTGNENIKDVEVCRWNTRRGWMVRLTAKWIEKESRWSVSYYKKGKTGSNYQSI